MSSLQPKKKKTLAQLRAEEKQQLSDLLTGDSLLREVRSASDYEFDGLGGWPADVCNARLNELLAKANRGCELLQQQANFFDACYEYEGMLHYRANFHCYLNQYGLAVSAYQQLDEFNVERDRKGLIKAVSRQHWQWNVYEMGFVCLDARQFDLAKQCFLRVLAKRGLACLLSRMLALQGLARYYKERREWTKVIEHCEDALKLIPYVREDPTSEGAEEDILLLLADAAEGLGDMEGAHTFGLKAQEAWHEGGGTKIIPGEMECPRREAALLLAEGKAHDAVQTLEFAKEFYLHAVEYEGTYFREDKTSPLCWPHSKAWPTRWREEGMKEMCPKLR